VKLRKHQSEIVQICQEILKYRQIKEIILSVTPGGGKSAIPVILADNLIPAIADKLLWVVPRNSLKYQGEAEFCESRWNTFHRLRATDGNEPDPSRGLTGYLTTYQAIGQDPELHEEEFKTHSYILFLDEPHHVAAGSTWEDALRPLVESAELVVYASGTLSRGDTQEIAFLPYSNSFVDSSNTSERRIIKYTRNYALQEKSICPIVFQTFDCSARWEEQDGREVEIESISEQENATKGLYTALRTEFAFQLLESCISNWRLYRDEHYSDAKLLVVAPNIKYAMIYHEHLCIYHPDLTGEVATSDNSEAAICAIESFKKGVSSYLVTVAMAYEGLSVPSITHIACLTHIRSVPWLEQCFARGNRLAQGKECAFVFGPKDHYFLEAIKMIETEQLVPATSERLQEGNELDESGTEGTRKPWITPLRSQAIRLEQKHHIVNQLQSFSPSLMENALKSSIRERKRLYLSKRTNGAIKTGKTLLNAVVRTIVDKPIDDMTIDELSKVDYALRMRFPV
jgi:superfamily II DNA or RNA helicase